MTLKKTLNIKVSEIEATEIGTKFLIIFINNFKSLIWSYRCNKVIEWEQKNGIVKSAKCNYSQRARLPSEDNSLATLHSLNLVDISGTHNPTHAVRPKLFTSRALQEEVRCLDNYDTSEEVDNDGHSNTYNHARHKQSRIERLNGAIKTTFRHMITYIGDNWIPPWMFRQSQYFTKSTNIDGDTWQHVTKKWNGDDTTG